jgi:hypothetical protein
MNEVEWRMFAAFIDQGLLILIENDNKYQDSSKFVHRCTTRVPIIF